MPELPEVETIRRDLAKSILHKTLRSIDVPDPFVLRNPTAQFIKALNKQTIKAVSRRGKALIIEFSNGYHLVVQLMMTGQLVVSDSPHKHTRVVFTFTDNTKLLYNDVRRFGQLRAVKDLKDVKHFSILGPEPFDKTFNPQFIVDYTRTSKRPIKTLLLDHTFVAGIGNIYACEILFRARISPTRASGKITAAEAKFIHHQIVDVLNEAIKHRGSSMRNYRDAKGEEGNFKKLISVYARQDKPCVVCKKPVVRIVQAGRSTFYCASCQR